jgi:hypothetical protein
MRAVMAEPIWSIGRTASARPASVIARGMPHTTEVAWSCAIA